MNKTLTYSKLYLALIGTMALSANVANSQDGNTSYGLNALLSNTTGDTNSAFGDGSLYSRHSSFGSLRRAHSAELLRTYIWVQNRNGCWSSDVAVWVDNRARPFVVHLDVLL